MGKIKFIRQIEKAHANDHVKKIKLNNRAHAQKNIT